MTIYILQVINSGYSYFMVLREFYKWSGWMLNRKQLIDQRFWSRRWRIVKHIFLDIFFLLSSVSTSVCCCTCCFCRYKRRALLETQVWFFRRLIIWIKEHKFEYSKWALINSMQSKIGLNVFLSSFFLLLYIWLHTNINKQIIKIDKCFFPYFFLYSLKCSIQKEQKLLSYQKWLLNFGLTLELGFCEATIYPCDCDLAHLFPGFA